MARMAGRHSPLSLRTSCRGSPAASKRRHRVRQPQEGASAQPTSSCERRALPPRSPAAQVEAVLRSLLGGNAKIGDVSGTISSRVHDKVLLLDSIVAEGGAATRLRLVFSKLLFEQLMDEGYELYMPLHNLWAAYMRRLMESCRGVLLQQRLYGADLHGANISVVRAKDPSLVGVSGIVVKDMQRSFHIVARDDTVKVVPKDGAVFCLSVDSLKVRLYGGQLSSIGRPAERTATVEL
eukprot:SM000052S17802  [mRNA]  locus=s52:641933:643746:- [translate_table: standard]